MRQVSSSRSKNNHIVREENIVRTISALRLCGPMSVTELMEATGLSYPTVFGIVKSLLDDRIVEHHGYATSTGGRQASLYSISANYGYTLGVHIYPSWVALAITNISDGVVYQYRDAAALDAGKLEQLLADRLETALNHVGIPRDKIILAGICESDSVRLQLSAASVDPCRVIERYTGVCPKCVTDSFVQGYLDRERFSCSGLNDFIHMVFGETVGITVYKKNSPAFSLSSEFLHLTAAPEGAVCSCGKRGCLDAYFNGSELYRTYCGLCSDRGQEADEALSKDKHLFKTLLARYLTGDLCAGMAVSWSTAFLGVSIANLMMIVGEYRLVLSGLYNSNNMQSFSLLRKAVHDSLPVCDRKKMNIEMGIALPDDCASGVCRLLNSSHHFHANNSFYDPER